MNNLSFKARRVIPRWRDFRTAAKLGELDERGSSGGTSSAVSTQIKSDLSPIWADWRSAKNEHTAGELLSAGLFANDADAVKEASDFILHTRNNCSFLARDVANSAISDDNTIRQGDGFGLSTSLHASVRSILRVNPSDAVAWADLARFHTINGRQDKAARAILTAIQLAPSNRYILRTAVRCLIHLDEVDRAYYLLSKNERTAYDPWLLAAQISVCDIVGKTTRFKKAAQYMQSGGFSPKQISELRAALATQEAGVGNDKKAKKLLNQAIEDPTENVIAQAWWSVHALRFPAPVHLVGQPHGFEADTKAALSASDWETATRASSSWFKDEAFSSRPAVTLSFLHGVIFDEHHEAIKVSKSALRANPADTQLLNNLAYSLAATGALDEASDFVELAFRHSESPRFQIAPIATRGMIAFRSGDAEAGRHEYLESIRLARKLGLDHMEAMARLFFAAEEKRHSQAEAQPLIEEAIECADKLNNPACNAVKNILLNGPAKRTSVE